MVDHKTYARYSIPLERQMAAIAQLGPYFLKAVREAEIAECKPELLSDAHMLMAELSGKPGEGALAVYRDLEKNIQSTKRFMDKWESVDGVACKRVHGEAARVHDALLQMQQLVAQTPPEVLAAIKQNIKTTFHMIPTLIRALIFITMVGVTLMLLLRACGT